MILPTSSTLRLFAISIAVACAGAQALGGSYSQNFNASAVGATTLGDGSTISASAGSITTSVQQIAAGNNALQLMLVGWGGATAAYVATAGKGASDYYEDAQEQMKKGN